MSRKNSDSGDPAMWIRYAKADLALAQVPLPEDSFYEPLCFHTQQAAEKALKAVLIANAISYPKTHNIRTLLDLLPETIVLPADVDDATSLTDYAVSGRYPNEMEDIAREEYLKAVTLAQAVVQWAESLLQASETHLPLFRRTPE